MIIINYNTYFGANSSSSKIKKRYIFADETHTDGVRSIEHDKNKSCNVQEPLNEHISTHTPNMAEINDVDDDVKLKMRRLWLRMGHIIN